MKGFCLEMRGKDALNTSGKWKIGIWNDIQRLETTRETHFTVLAES